MLVNCWQDWKTELPMLVTLAGIVRLVRPLDSKASLSIVVRLAESVRPPRLKHAAKVWNPMLVTLSASVTLVRLVQYPSANRPRLLTPLPIVARARPVQWSKARFPRLVTLSGTVTAARFGQYWNAPY